MLSHSVVSIISTKPMDYSPLGSSAMGLSRKTQGGYISSPGTFLETPEDSRRLLHLLHFGSKKILPLTPFPRHLSGLPPKQIDMRAGEPGRGCTEQPLGQPGQVPLSFCLTSSRLRAPTREKAGHPPAKAKAALRLPAISGSTSVTHGLRPPFSRPWGLP